jgi:hypothetical protein
MQAAIKQAQLRRWLTLSTGAVSGAGLVIELLDNFLQDNRLETLVRFFSLSYENNLPSWYASLLLALCGATLWMVALATRQQPTTGKNYVKHWYFLACSFFYISLDELVGLHEHASEWFPHFRGWLFYSWVLPGGAIVVLLAMAYFQFLAHLQVATRIRFVVAGGLYVMGALVLEIPLGWITQRWGVHSMPYVLLDWLEESLELLGLSLFFLSLVDHLRRKEFRLEINPLPTEKSELFPPQGR